mgnify:CR=1 FL=1
MRGEKVAKYEVVAKISIYVDAGTDKEARMKADNEIGMIEEVEVQKMSVFRLEDD